MAVTVEALEAAARVLYARTVKHQVEYDPREEGDAPNWDSLPERDKAEYRYIVFPYLEAGACQSLAVALRHAASQMKDSEDAAWLDSWADELDET